MKAVYPGTFDPITNGHLDLIARSLSIFDSIIVAVAVNPGKKPLFTVKERVGFIRKATAAHNGRVLVESFDNLLVDFCVSRGVHTMVRGLRAVSDFEYELQLSQMNRKINKKVEAVFIMPSEEYTFISSKIIKEVAGLGGDVSALVPPGVADALRRKRGAKGRKSK